MAPARQAHDALPPIRVLDLLVVAPISYCVRGMARFQFGGGLYCAALVAGLADLGHRVRVLASGPPPTGRESPDPLGRGVDVRWFALEYRSVRTPPPHEYVRSERAKLELALDAELEVARPDLVVLGSESQAWYAAEACGERGLRSLLISHGVPTAALPLGIYPPREVAALVSCLGRVDRIVTVSHHLEEVLRSLGLTRIETIPTGVDTEMFRPRPKDPALARAHGIDPGHFVVGSFSHLRPGKRIADLIGSAELVTRAEPRSLYLVGGDGLCRDEAATLVSRAGLASRFRFLGELGHAAIPAHIALCDVVVLTSEREGCGLVCLEAQASGRPVIYSDIAAGRELVEDGESGILFRLGDVEDLAAKTLRLFRNPALSRRLAKKGRAVALEKTQERWIRACSDAILETARGGRAP